MSTESHDIDRRLFPDRNVELFGRYWDFASADRRWLLLMQPTVALFEVRDGYPAQVPNCSLVSKVNNLVRDTIDREERDQRRGCL